MLLVQPQYQQSYSFATSSTSSGKHAYGRKEGLAAAITKQYSPKLVLTAEGSRLQRDFANDRADPLATLKMRFDAGTADLETVKIALDSVWHRLEKIPRSRRHQHIRDYGVGASTLKWLWSTDQRWSAAVQADSKFLQRVCYFAVGEGLEDLLVSWMAQHLQVSAIQDTHQWRGGLLRAIIKAHLLLATRNSADDAIRLFLDIRRQVHENRQLERTNGPGDLARVSLWPAMVELGKKLTSGWFGRTNSKLYEQFMGVCFAQPRYTDYSKARLTLWHPTKPDPDDMLCYLRKFLEPMSKEDYTAAFPVTTSNGETMYFNFRVLEEVLRR